MIARMNSMDKRIAQVNNNTLENVVLMTLTETCTHYQCENGTKFPANFYLRLKRWNISIWNQ